jgi:tetratricopeptide (TPR) repeat protein
VSSKDHGKKSGRILEMKGKPQPKTQPAHDAAYTQAIDTYQEGLRALQERKFEKAKNVFQKLTDSPIRELADRAQVHLSTCNQHIERGNTNFKTVEEHYDYSVSLMNLGDYVAAREHLERILKQSPKTDFVLYGMAVLNCLTGRAEDALHYLHQAIQVNPANRFQARNDSDFRNLADDPRFTELLYPETGDDAYGPA